jgi:hypothetical protein
VIDETSSSSNPVPLWERITSNGAIGLAGLYTLGFLIAGSYLSSVSVPSLELFRIRYVAAAAWFIILTSIPLGFTIGVERYIIGSIWPSKRSRRRKFMIVVGYVAFSLLMAGMLWNLIVRQVTIGSQFVGSFLSILYFVAIAVFAFAAHAVDRATFADRTPLGLAVWVLTLATILIATQLFAALIYPAIRPGLGGGGAWEVYAHIGQTSGEESQHVRAALIDRDSHLVHFALCSPARTEKVLEYVSFPHALIERVTLAQETTLRDFQLSCMAERSEGG